MEPVENTPLGSDFRSIAFVDVFFSPYEVLMNSPSHLSLTSMENIMRWCGKEYISAFLTTALVHCECGISDYD